MAYVQVNVRDVQGLYNRFRPVAQVMDILGLFLLQEIKDRFATQGASGGTPWRPKWTSLVGYHDGRAILTGPTGALLQSWFGYGQAGEAIAASDCFYALLHQLGTVGKGGTLPTIRPRNAKALFIPITDRAIHSERLTGSTAGAVAQLTGQVPYGAKPPEGPRRFAVKQHRTESGGYATEYGGLIKGRIKDGRLQAWDAKTGTWTDHIPDFIFLAKIEIPSRPMLPLSDHEISEALHVLCDAQWFNQRSRRIRADGTPVEA